MPEVTVANTQAVETVSPPTFNHSTEEQHNEFRHILLLLRLATAYNYGESMLPDQDYANHFDAAADRMYRQQGRRRQESRRSRLGRDMRGRGGYWNASTTWTGYVGRVLFQRNVGA
jgi:hypothetical protein